MNAELQRQHAAAITRRARIAGGIPQCRAIVSETIAEPALPKRRKPRQLSPVREAIEREHQVRMACVTAAYEAERATRRSMFAAAMEACRERELADLRDCEQYRRDMLAEAGE